MSSRAAALAGLLLTAPLATAQSAANDAGTAERPTVWAGLGLETIVPFGSLGVSAPVGRVGTLTVAPRLGVDALLLLGPVVSADVLFSGADVGVYGGPSAGLFLAGQGGWRAGVVGGYRSRTRPDLGFFVEGGLRYTVVRDAFTGFVAPPPGQAPTPPRDLTLVSPSLRLGVTYRF
ncbi:hypothetical protein [Deinococcus soli (ex Cha et al. 2016)]|uniref:Uncharacterized protein n=2 Tax=Deinococcus soli (ex Cha et al. 2016) TaxID=1309411 RepID=A0ACC6KAT2_9DEIO|nr:hypothetical protein [Deinococcus soli (ex Cha et al. 2016)]MDR6216534.1 hypothetical protein [Deinococcus soli (ex Cha et al. 2016)]MDR6327355.1 hypothetical protein [Deinococcus soli (ex Cha et al. 2016)]MDR6749630.1 hypothetical protein [Deinococcus soli (ex Cha et al. 2016)]